MDSKELNSLCDEVVREIRSREPDAFAPDSGVCQDTVRWVADVVTRWFRDRIFDLSSKAVPAYKRIVVATEDDSQSEALYVDGTLITCEMTIYAAEIASNADGKPVIIVNRQVVLGSGMPFPNDEADLVDVSAD